MSVSEAAIPTGIDQFMFGLDHLADHFQEVLSKREQWRQIVTADHRELELANTAFWVWRYPENCVLTLDELTHRRHRGHPDDHEATFV